MMALLQISLCRTLILALGFIGVASPVLAGPLEDLSAVSNSVHTMATCPAYNKKEAHSALSQAAACVQVTNGNSLEKQGLALSEISEKAEAEIEDRYFAILAAQHANELVCASKFADDVQKGNPVSDKILKQQFRDVRAFKLALNEAVQNLQKNPQVSSKVCPLSMADLNRDYPIKDYSNEATRNQEPNYSACAQIISARANYQKTMGAISLAQFPTVQKALDKYSISEKELSDAELEKLIHSTYKNAKDEVIKQAHDIRTKATTEGGSAFNRNDRHALLTDPRLAEKVLADGGQSTALKAVACSADARYGSGADSLDKDLFFGSLLISGGMVVKAVGTAAKIANAANAGRALGTYSLTTVNIVKLGAIAGVHSAATWSAIDKACSSNKINTKVKAGDACSDAPSIEKMEQDNCYLAATTAAMQVAPSTAVAGLTAAQNRMAKALRGRALEAKIQARRAVIDARNSTPPKATQVSAATETPKKGVTVVNTDPTTATADGMKNVTTRSQFEIARAKKENELRLAALEKEAEKMRAAGVDEYDIHFKQMRDQELANMKNEGLYTTKPPTGTRFDDASLVKGGKGPFESKAGDINLITAEQIKQLERHNPGTVIYNYKTGEELVLGLDDIDPESLIKIGGKFSQWGFKVAP